MSGSFGQASGKASDALLAADAAWMKVYAAKDLEKSVAFFGRCWSITYNSDLPPIPSVPPA
jgi:hypothetical protein